jgi:hypothetical protein
MAKGALPEGTAMPQVPMVQRQHLAPAGTDWSSHAGLRRDRTDGARLPGGDAAIGDDPGGSDVTRRSSECWEAGRRRGAAQAGLLPRGEPQGPVIRRRPRHGCRVDHDAEARICTLNRIGESDTFAVRLRQRGFVCAGNLGLRRNGSSPSATEQPGAAVVERAANAKAAVCVSAAERCEQATVWHDEQFMKCHVVQGEACQRDEAAAIG